MEGNPLEIDENNLTEQVRGSMSVANKRDNGNTAIE
jgi:hypothetical protein